MKIVQFVRITHGGKNYHCSVYPSTVEVSVEIPRRMTRPALGVWQNASWRYLRSGTPKQREIAALALVKLAVRSN